MPATDFISIPNMVNVDAFGILDVAKMKIFSIVMMNVRKGVMEIRLKNCWKNQDPYQVKLHILNWQSTNILACFQKIDSGQCEASVSPKNVTRFAYVADSKICKPFQYSSCGGNDNRFESESECKDFCGTLVSPNSDKCVYQPDWGPCNQLRYQWFYNLSSGVCEQFLYGGCGGNPNRFASFELCQVTCEVPSAGIIFLSLN